MQENAEKKRTINGPFTPFVPRIRTYVYAIPAPIPPRSPIKAGSAVTEAKPGLITNKLPIKAIHTQLDGFFLLEVEMKTKWQRTEIVYLK